jgi:hypothetical protein
MDGARENPVNNQLLLIWHKSRLSPQTNNAGWKKYKIKIKHHILPYVYKRPAYHLIASSPVNTTTTADCTVGDTREVEVAMADATRTLMLLTIVALLVSGIV